MATTKEYANGLLDEPKVTGEASTYEPVQREINQSTDTVSGQLDTLLSEDSKFLTRARTSGKQYAASRGLLNSSMAAQATEAAAIDAAMPIAQQDADANFRQGLENQSAGNTALSTNAQLETNVSTANAANDLSARNTALGEIGATERIQIGEAGAIEREQMKNDTATLIQGMKDEASRFETELRELSQTERQQIIADTDIATSTARLDAEKIVNNAKVSAENKKTFSTAFNEMSRQNYVEITKIETDPELSVDAKNRLTASQNARYTADTKLLSALYSNDIGLDIVLDERNSNYTTNDTNRNEFNEPVDASGNIILDPNRTQRIYGNTTYTYRTDGLLVDPDGNLTTPQKAQSLANIEKHEVDVGKWEKKNIIEYSGGLFRNHSSETETLVNYKKLKASWKKEFPTKTFPYEKTRNNPNYDPHSSRFGGGEN